MLAAAFGLVAQALPASEASPTRWAVEAGYSHRFWESFSTDSDEQRAYQDRARNGWNLAGDVAVFPFPVPVGIGVAYSRFGRALTDPSIGFPDGTTGRMRDVYTLHYAGPALFYRQALPASFEAVASAGAGWLYYHNHHKAKDYPGVLEGNTWGLQGSLSLDYRPFRFLGVGLGARGVHGSLDALDYNAMRTPFPTLSLTRVDFFAGLRFYP